MQFNRSNGDGESIEEQTKSTLGEAKDQAVADSVGKMLGTFTGFMLTALFVPWLAVYAYNGLQPAVWPDISYLPAVAGFFVFQSIIRMLKSE